MKMLKNHKFFNFSNSGLAVWHLPRNRDMAFGFHFGRVRAVVCHMRRPCTILFCLLTRDPFPCSSFVSPVSFCVSALLLCCSCLFLAWLCLRFLVVFSFIHYGVPPFLPCRCLSDVFLRPLLFYVVCSFAPPSCESLFLSFLRFLYALFLLFFALGLSLFASCVRSIVRYVFLSAVALYVRWSFRSCGSFHFAFCFFLHVAISTFVFFLSCFRSFFLACSFHVCRSVFLSAPHSSIHSFIPSFVQSVIRSCNHSFI